MAKLTQCQECDNHKLHTVKSPIKQPAGKQWLGATLYFKKKKEKKRKFAAIQSVIFDAIQSVIFCISHSWHSANLGQWSME